MTPPPGATQATFLTLGASLNEECVPLLSQIVSANSTPTTTAIQTEFQVLSRSDNRTWSADPRLTSAFPCNTVCHYACSTG